MASGEGKRRYNEPRTARARLVFLSSSNEPLSAYASMDPNTAAAIRVRMPTIDLSDRPFGILDHGGRLGAAQTIETINRAIAENFGHASLILISHVTRRLSVGDPVLPAFVKGLIKLFRQRAGYSDLSAKCQRVCNAFALVYATAIIARGCGALPKKWMRLGDALFSTFQLAIDGLEPNDGAAIQALKAEFSAFGDRLEVLGPSGPPSDSPGTVGYIKSAKFGLELWVRPDQFTLHLNKFRAVMGVLVEEGILKTDGAHKAVSRTIKGGKIERVHVFRLAEGSCPGQIKFAQSTRSQS